MRGLLRIRLDFEFDVEINVDYSLLEEFVANAQFGTRPHHRHNHVEQFLGLVARAGNENYSEIPPAQWTGQQRDDYHGEERRLSILPTHADHDSRFDSLSIDAELEYVLDQLDLPWEQFHGLAADFDELIYEIENLI